MFNRLDQNKKVFVNWYGYLILLTVFVFSTYFFYASYVYSGEGASGDYTNCTDTTDNDSDTYIDAVDFECLRAPGVPDMDVNTDSGASGTDNNTNDTTPNFSVTCDGTQTVYLKEGGTLLASGTCSVIGESSSVNFENISLDEGVHSITATQWGGANGGTDQESSASEALIVTIDTIINTPGDPILQLASDTGISNTDEYTSDNTPTYDISCESGAEVQLLLGGGAVGTGTCVGGTVAITSSAQSAGVWSFNAVQTDLANGQSIESGGSQITIDTIWEGGNPDSAPDLEAGSDSGYSGTDDITNDTTPTFTGSCSGSDYVYLYDDGTLSNYVLCDGSYYSLASGILSSGTNSMVVKFGDLAGNTGAGSSPLSVTIDSSAPATTGTPDLTVETDSGSSSTDNLTSDSTPDFSITCETDAIVTLYVDGVSNQIGTCTSSPVTITLGTISGTVEITAKQTDVAGNTSASFSSGLSVTIDTTAPTTSGAPDMTSGTDSGSSSSDDTTSDTTPTFTGVCTDGTTVQLYDDGVSSGSSTTCASSVFSLTTGILAEGSNSITFKETDTAGNTSTASTALPVTIDTTAPTISEVTAVPAGTDTTPNYVFTTDQAGTISYGGSCSSVTTSATQNENTITLDALAVGTYSDCTVIVTDSASNASNTLTMTSFTISAPAVESTPTTNTNLTGSAPSRLTTLTPTKTPNLPACLEGESFNRNTGLPCTNNTPEVPGCSSGFSFSPLTGQSCPAKTNTPVTPATPTPNTPTPTPETPDTPTFTKNLKLGDIDPEVKLLQRFLNTNGFSVTLTGNGSLGKEINRFGLATRAALIKFQKANVINPAIGYFGPVTRKYINNL